MSPASEGEPRPIRTFHGRHGRASKSAAASVDRMWPSLGVDLDGTPLDLGELFGTGVPVVVELGSGMGEVAAAMAVAEPDIGILAVDVHTPGIAALVQVCEREQITNVRVAYADGVEMLRTAIAPGSLHGIRAFFPDPWPKTRHQKRRLIRPDLVSMFAQRLAPGGFIHTATDWSEYAEQMLAVLSAEPLLRNDSVSGYAIRPDWRPMTKFESIGIAKGHQINDLIFRRVTEAAEYQASSALPK